ncbi:hypothetical protein F5887DRAFT_922079 [Amanita rubescens]|nr:hypothetical protein F5887DRAFT_922079 [Amanita rubescens]
MNPILVIPQLLKLYTQVHKDIVEPLQQPANLVPPQTLPSPLLNIVEQQLEGLENVNNDDLLDPVSTHSTSELPSTGSLGQPIITSYTAPQTEISDDDLDILILHLCHHFSESASAGTLIMFQAQISCGIMMDSMAFKHITTILHKLFWNYFWMQLVGTVLHPVCMVTMEWRISVLQLGWTRILVLFMGLIFGDEAFTMSELSVCGLM